MHNFFALIISFSFMIMSGCGKFDVINEPAKGISQAHNICIIKDGKTREGFSAAMESWLSKEGIKYSVLPVGSDVEICDWSLKYYGLWSWDLALFLSDAEITAFREGKLVGREKLRVGQWDAHKFEKGEVRIHKMMDMLFSKTDHYKLN